MNWAKRREAISFALILFWLFFTVSFAIWWLTLSTEHIAKLAELQPERLEHWQRQLRMVQWEGTAWIALLVSGGAALALLVRRERQRVKRIREFFASFTHDVKTSLSSLRLQAEALADDLKGQSSPILGRLIGDTVRLQLQLENSLFFASQDQLRLIPEKVRLSQLLERLREQWPTLRIAPTHDAILHGDERALRTIFSNLTKNAVAHGHASELKIDVAPETQGHLRLRFEDNGIGFEGSLDELGRLFHRPMATSGSGLGLYICRLLIEKMNGRLQFYAGHQGFRVDLVVEGERQ